MSIRPAICQACANGFFLARGRPPRFGVGDQALPLGASCWPLARAPCKRPPNCVRIEFGPQCRLADGRPATACPPNGCRKGYGSAPGGKCRRLVCQKPEPVAACRVEFGVLLVLGSVMGRTSWSVVAGRGSTSEDSFVEIFGRNGRGEKKGQFVHEVVIPPSIQMIPGAGEWTELRSGQGDRPDSPTLCGGGAGVDATGGRLQTCPAPLYGVILEKIVDPRGARQVVTRVRRRRVIKRTS